MLGRVVFSCTLWLLMVSAAPGQDWARKMFDSLDHDFGAVARGSKVEHRFLITNCYEEDVHVTGVRSSCGCTTPEVTVKTVKTWETSELVATFNTRDFLGQRSATLTITFDKPFHAETQVQIRGYVRSDVVLDPPAIEFGTVDAHATPEQVVQVAYAGRNDWKVVDVKSPSPHVRAEFREVSRTSGDVRYELHVQLIGDTPPGYFRNHLTLVTNDSRSPELPVEINGHVAAEISVNPSPLVMGVLEPGQSVTKKLVVRGKAPFRITSVECDAVGYRFEPSQEVKAVHVVPVVLQAGAQPGALTGTIRIQTDPALAVPEIITRAEIAAGTAQQP